MAMSKHKMQFYNASSGVVFTLSWADEREYRLGRDFLQKLVGPSLGRVELHPDKPDFYYLEGDAQCDALFDFWKSLRAKRSRRHS